MLQTDNIYFSFFPPYGLVEERFPIFMHSFPKIKELHAAWLCLGDSLDLLYVADGDVGRDIKSLEQPPFLARQFTLENSVVRIWERAV